MADKKNAFLLYKDQWESISDLDDKYLGQLFRAIFEYQVHGIEPENHSVIYRDFKHFKPHFDRDNAKYQDIVDKKKLAGAEGGKQKAAKLADASISQKNKQDLANVALNDNDNVNVNVLITPISPSSADAKEGKKKRTKSEPRVETTLEKAKSHYKTEIELAKCSSAAAADIEGFRRIALEICGLHPTDECPNGMVNTVMRLPEQLTFKQYMNLMSEWRSFDVIRRTLLEVHNTYVQYHSKRHSVNLVMQGWNRKDFKKSPAVAQQLPPNVASVTKEVHQ